MAIKAQEDAGIDIIILERCRAICMRDGQNTDEVAGSAGDFA
jgi:hypothetical protein